MCIVPAFTDTIRSVSTYPLAKRAIPAFPALRIHHLPLLLSAANTSRARELIDRIIEENTLWPQNRLSCAGMFLALLEALDHALNPPESRGRESIYVAKAKKYIFTNLGFPIHQRDIANHLGISPQYLCDIFKKAEGMAAHDLYQPNEAR